MTGQWRTLNKLINLYIYHTEDNKSVISLNAPRIEIKIRTKATRRITSWRRSPNTNSTLIPKQLLTQHRLTSRRSKTRREKRHLINFDKRMTISDIAKAEDTNGSLERESQKEDILNDSIGKISYPIALHTQSERCQTPFSEIGSSFSINKI